MKYYFRGMVILDYDEETKEITAPVDEDTGRPNIDACKFIQEDFQLLQNFFTAVNIHQVHPNMEFEDIEVY